MVAGKLTAIARFPGIAEAGFFAHELMQQAEIPCSLTAKEDFDAVTGFWTTSFVLSVPADRSELAAVRLQQLVDEQEGRAIEPREETLGGFEDLRSTQPWAFDSMDSETDLEVESGSPIPWGAVLLTLTAGTFAFMFFKAQQPPPAKAAQRQRDSEFWNAVSTGDPWLQRMKSGGTRKVWFDSESRNVRIEEDFDGDGIADRVRTFAPVGQ